MCRHQGDQKAVHGPSLWSSVSAEETGIEQNCRPAGQPRPGLSEGGGQVPEAALRGSGPAGQGLGWALQGQSRGNSMGASGNSRCKRPRKAGSGRLGEEGRLCWAPRRWQEPAGGLRGVRGSVFIRGAARSRWLSGCLLLCFLFFGGWCDQLHSVKCESYFGGKIDKTRW